MVLRAAFVVSVLLLGLVLGLVTDLGVWAGQALAQPYPSASGPYPTRSQPGQSRQLPPVEADEDEDLDTMGPPPFGSMAGPPPLPTPPYASRGGYSRDTEPYFVGPPPAPAPGVQYGALSAYPQGTDPHASAPPNPPDVVHLNGNSPPGYATAPAVPKNAGQGSVIIAPLSANTDHGGTSAVVTPDNKPETGPAQVLPPQLRRTTVDISTQEPAGTIIIDTPNTYLYLVLGNGKAMRYGIGVGREGFTWSGTERISRMAEWPDWYPPAEMVDRQPYLPRFVAGGETNPLGARALYLGKTLYRIHGTNQPSTIGTFGSSGCVRLTNEDIIDLYGRVQLGTRVVVLPGTQPATAQRSSSASFTDSMPSASSVVRMLIPWLDAQIAP